MALSVMLAAPPRRAAPQPIPAPPGNRSAGIPLGAQLLAVIRGEPTQPLALGLGQRRQDRLGLRDRTGSVGAAPVGVVAQPLGDDGVGGIKRYRHGSSSARRASSISAAHMQQRRSVG